MCYIYTFAEADMKMISKYELLDTLRCTGKWASNCSHKYQQALKMPGLSQAALSFQHAGHLDKGKGFGKAKKKKASYKRLTERNQQMITFSPFVMQPLFSVLALRCCLQFSFAVTNHCNLNNKFSSLFSDKLIIAYCTYTTVFMYKTKWFKGGWKISLKSI